MCSVDVRVEGPMPYNTGARGWEYRTWGKWNCKWLEVQILWAGKRGSWK